MIQRLVRLLTASVAMTGAVLLLSMASVRADDAGDGVHLGVATCEGSPCHGNALGKKVTGVLQNEYLVWQREDTHHKAFTVLQGELGKRIGRNLGIDPTTAKECLDCHADNVAPEQRGVQFQLSDGVGCEACHGSSQSWLGPHASGKVTHAQLVSDYHIYPTEKPIERAELCLKCHFGDDKRFVTHRIMGAGHPRLAFELQTFTQIQPAHFVIDDVYRKRKTVAQGVQVWAVGQALALNRIATLLQDPAHKGDGVFPELVFFDCDACHHPTSSLRWERRASAGLGPGLPHVNDANAIMLHAITARLAPEEGKSLEKAMLALHAAMSEGKGSPREAAAQVAQISKHLSEVFATHTFTKEDIKVMALALAERGQAGDDSDYAAAEQTTMALAALIYTLQSDGMVDAKQYSGLKAALEQCYSATQKEDAYQPAKFVQAAGAVAHAMP